jgi:pimeloyl-ACP methyl ester carboxylesterase
MNTSLAIALAASVISAGVQPAAAVERPTIVLVHGAFADGSSWHDVMKLLHAEGFSTISAANTLRSVESDSGAIAALVKSIKGPVVLVGHSYGGVLISNAARDVETVKALVFVGAFAPEAGESAAELSAKYPGGQLGEAIDPAPLPGGGVDLYIRADRFHAVFAADVDLARAKLMAASQRPVTQSALMGPSGSPAWRKLPSWFIYGDADKCIPAAALAFMAERAASKQTVVLKGASHALAVSHPKEVAKLIATAATASTASKAAVR